MTQQEIIINSFRHLIYRSCGIRVDGLSFELVDENVYTLDINVKKIPHKTVNSVVELASKHESYLTHELLKSTLRLHFEF